ncbi:hypothetical protein Csa_010023 [Cucumis sativus]|uniref:Uncharacterized protein n=1 Tax=Cucumis sativus TaxID=3659 RepID=A0A0A0L6D0_CUCSA|nr:hypothetical protein Csa_010023 [Cucumis sativus]
MHNDIRDSFHDVTSAKLFSRHRNLRQEKSSLFPDTITSSAQRASGEGHYQRVFLLSSGIDLLIGIFDNHSYVGHYVGRLFADTICNLTRCHLASKNSQLVVT